MVNTPAAPDPYTTAAAQTQSNENTANYQQSLNQTNQITPYGSINYEQTGTAPNGAPTSTATTTLSQPVQNLVNTGIDNAQTNANTEGQLANNAQSTLSQPLNLSNLSQLPTLTGWNDATLDPQWARNDQNAAQTAYNQGLAPGSSGWSAEMQNEGTLKNQAYDQSNLANIGTAVNATEQQYNEPLNALSALQSGSQISQPGVGQTAAAPQTSVAGTNISGLVEQNYQQQLAQSNAAMGGLFGLGGAGIQAAGMFL